MTRTRILHIAAHLGGGVGRVLSELVRHRRRTESSFEDVFVCLERPTTARYAHAITATGADLFVAPSSAELEGLIASADVVQLEWWHHPLLAAWMHSFHMPARVVVWAHVSGLHYPAFPAAFAALPDSFLLTSAVSLNSLGESHSNILRVINSTGGFDDLHLPEHRNGPDLRYGYLGSLNPSKLHPDILEYLNAVSLPGFSVDFYGDTAANPFLQSAQRARHPRLILRGFTDRPSTVLGNMDVFVYLLNPTHYGTTENALLEAMACGVVPIVFDNPVERSIVEHGRTGLVVNSPRSFSEAVTYLHHNPAERQQFAASAASAVRARHSISRCSEQLEAVYLELLNKPKRQFDFANVFGETPADWFTSCLGSYARYFQEDAEESQRQERLKYPFLYEKTKSSALHFASYFPTEPRLAHWVSMLEADLAINRS